MLSVLVLSAAFTDGRTQAPAVSATPSGLDFIDTGFENASPLWYEVAPDGSIQINLLYDHERASPNRAAGHIHFLIHAKTGSKLTLEFRNLDNVWNGQPGSVAAELKAVAISENGREWTPVPTETLPGNRVRLTVQDARPAPLRGPGRALPVVRSRSPARLHSQEPPRADHVDRQDCRRTRARSHSDRQRERALSRLPAGAGAPVGIRQQLGCGGADPAAAERRRRREDVSGAVRRLHAADGEQGRRGARHDALQSPRQGPQSKLGHAG